MNKRVKSIYALMVAFICIITISCAKSKNTNTGKIEMENELTNFIKDYEAKVRLVVREAAITYFKASITVQGSL